MLAILISESAPIDTIIKILVVKFILGMIYGFVIDFILKMKNKNKQEEKIIDICEEEHWHCEKGILKSALKHTINIFLYIFVLTLILNIVVEIIGEETLSNILSKGSIFAPILASFIGLIPNCASSVIITELYLSNIVSFGSLIAGLLVNSGTRIINAI